MSCQGLPPHSITSAASKGWPPASAFSRTSRPRSRTRALPQLSRANSALDARTVPGILVLMKPSNVCRPVCVLRAADSPATVTPARESQATEPVSAATARRRASRKPVSAGLLAYCPALRASSASSCCADASVRMSASLTCTRGCERHILCDLAEQVRSVRHPCGHALSYCCSLFHHCCLCALIWCSQMRAMGQARTAMANSHRAKGYSVTSQHTYAEWPSKPAGYS